ncbi:unnamed protein product [Protopolystoma xenopodis]|uniref:Uncharacterized protein n=1 Tax=Protopolystoma xenopodis TaxID=117903 RepID=A0A448XIC4_9PLAT|nr:unnamed protein product [Protopolystoma xenopodis]
MQWDTVPTISISLRFADLHLIGETGVASHLAPILSQLDAWISQLANCLPGHCIDQLLSQLSSTAGAKATFRMDKVTVGQNENAYGLDQESSDHNLGLQASAITDGHLRERFDALMLIRFAGLASPEQKHRIQQVDWNGLRTHLMCWQAGLKAAAALVTYSSEQVNDSMSGRSQYMSENRQNESSGIDVDVVSQDNLGAVATSLLPDIKSRIVHVEQEEQDAEQRNSPMREGYQGLESSAPSCSTISPVNRGSKSGSCKSLVRRMAVLTDDAD